MCGREVAVAAEVRRKLVVVVVVGESRAEEEEMVLEVLAAEGMLTSW